MGVGSGCDWRPSWLTTPKAVRLQVMTTTMMTLVEDGVIVLWRWRSKITGGMEMGFWLPVFFPRAEMSSELLTSLCPALAWADILLLEAAACLLDLMSTSSVLCRFEKAAASDCDPSDCEILLLEGPSGTHPPLPMALKTCPCVAPPPVLSTREKLRRHSRWMEKAAAQARKMGAGREVEHVFQHLASVEQPPSKSQVNAR